MAASSTSSATNQNNKQTNEELLKQISNMRVGFVGCGRMAQAIARGFINQGVVKAKNIWASARGDETLKKVKNYGVNVTMNNEVVVDNTDVVILSVKPQMMDSVVRSLSDKLTKDKLIVSVAAGLPLSFFERRLKHDQCRLVRIMPNTPMLACAGASIYCVGQHVRPEDARIIEALFSSVGTCDQLPEELIDAATGISGSGPAYMFMAIEAMADAGVNAGLPREIAQKLAAQTVHGAGLLVLQSGQHPAELKDQVTSPAGTTIAAVQQLDRSGFRSALGEAVQQAVTRAKEIGQKFSDDTNNNKKNSSNSNDGKQS